MISNIWKWFIVIHSIILKNSWLENLVKNAILWKIKWNIFWKLVQSSQEAKQILNLFLALKIVFLERLDLVIHLSMKRKPRSFLVSFPKVSQMLCHSFPATIVLRKVIFLRVVMLESTMYLRELWNGSQKDLERNNHVGPKLSKGTM